MYSFSKRAFDLALSLLLLAILSPLMLLLALAVRLDSPGPALFRQRRVGRNGGEFLILKFRTMRTDAPPDTPTHLMTRASSCITSLGAFLRRTSLDELPQLFNILKGEMSFIGPRPLLVQYLPLYSPQQMRRHDVRPGISGWAQVNGRNELSWEQKFERDVWYVDHISFGLDMKILWMTIMNVLKQRGINTGVSETMVPFDGINKAGA